MPFMLKQDKDAPSQVTQGKLSHLQQQIQALSGLSTNSELAFLQKRMKMKELIVSALEFLKLNMIPGKKTPESLQVFYTGVLKLMSIMRRDYPEFLCDFHLNFTNSLPMHCI